MPSQRSARPPRSTPSHCSMRNAISGEMLARSFSNRDSWTLDTPSCSAASVTVSFKAGSTSSRRIAAGCGGLNIVDIAFFTMKISVNHRRNCSMVVPVIDKNRVLAVKLECQSPIPVHVNRPDVCFIPFQRMQPPSRLVHVARTLCSIQCDQQTSQLVLMCGLDSRHRSSFVKTLHALMAKTFDHGRFAS